MTPEELRKALDLHAKWLRCEASGVRALLREADLREADLRGADLRGANLREADLREADLREADLRRANLREADLREADLREADLRRANLREADLREADLRGVDLRRANLREADLREAVGLHVLTATQHGYTVLAVWNGDKWRIQAGCRDYTVAQAREHWGAKYPYPPDGERILLMLDWLEKQPTPEALAKEEG